MGVNLKQIFVSLGFEEEDKTRIANLLSITILTLFIIAVVRTALSIAGTQEYLVVVLKTNGFLVGILAGIFILTRAGYVRAACIVFTLYQWITVAWLTYHYGGVRVSAYGFFIFVILAAGLLLGGKWAASYAAISIAYGTLLLYLENQGVLLSPTEGAVDAFGITTPSFITTAVLVYLYHRDITRALAQARRNAAQLARTNEQLTREIAARERMEEQLLQVQKMEALGRLAGGIAHDFNNLLVPIMGYVDLHLLDLPPESDLYADLMQVRQAAERAANLTRQILAFSRQQMLELRVIDLNEVIEEFTKMLRRLIGENIELRKALSSSLHLITADRGQIEQVLLNLAVNARDAMPGGGRLTIETANVTLDEAYVEKYANDLTPGRYVMLAVSDTGKGMDAETQRHIFDPFYTTKKNSKGTGLGLSTVFGIVKQHQGNIWVYSEPDKGTTFKIYLPRSKEATQTSASITRETPSSMGGTETILVVEDEDIVRRLVCETLAAHGYDVIESQTPGKCLQLASGKDKIHLLLTDVVMPEMNGRKLYQELVVIHPDCKALYMSGYTDNVIHHHNILDEGVYFLQKPFTIHNLLRKVREVLERT